MVLKLFKAAWFLSAVVALANLLYIYAGIQQQEIVVQEVEGGALLITRDVFFYCSLGALAFVNFTVYLTSKVFAKEEDFRAWFHGLVVTINMFFVIAFSLIGTYNSAEKFDYSRIGFAIYGSVGLVVVWAVGWPVYRIFKAFATKQAV